MQNDGIVIGSRSVSHRL